jgi:hypothetical protein
VILFGEGGIMLCIVAPNNPRHCMSIKSPR